MLEIVDVSGDLHVLVIHALDLNIARVLCHAQYSLVLAEKGELEVSSYVRLAAELP